VESTLVYTDYIKSPLGVLEIRASSEGVTHVLFTTSKKSEINTNEITHRCKQQLNEYFSGKRKTFELPLDQVGSEFQKSVWSCLIQIPFGETVSYIDIANMMDKHNAARAVGGANGRNPISIIVPCHRVIGNNGILNGYAGGIERKLWLLNHEGVELKGSIKKLKFES